MTTEERKHVNLVASLGCIVCRNNGDGYSPALIHHVRETGEKRNHRKVLPLCPAHHQGPRGIGVHSGRKTWERIYGSQKDLLLQVEYILYG